MPVIDVGRTTTPQEGILGILAGIGQGLAQLQQEREKQQLEGLQILSKNPNVIPTPVTDPAVLSGIQRRGGIFDTLLGRGTQEQTATGQPVYRVGGGVPITFQPSTFGSDILRAVDAGAPGGVSAPATGINTLTSPANTQPSFPTTLPQGSPVTSGPITETGTYAPRAGIGVPPSATPAGVAQGQPISATTTQGQPPTSARIAPPPTPGTPEYAAHIQGIAQIAENSGPVRTAKLSLEALRNRGAPPADIVRALDTLSNARAAAMKNVLDDRKDAYARQQEEEKTIEGARTKALDLIRSIPDQQERDRLTQAANEAGTLREISVVLSAAPGGAALHAQLEAKNQRDQQERVFANQREFLELQTRTGLKADEERFAQQPLPPSYSEWYVDPKTGQGPPVQVRARDIDPSQYIRMSPTVQPRYQALMTLAGNVQRLRTIAQGGVDKDGTITGKPGSYFDGVLNSDPGFFQKVDAKGSLLLSKFSGTPLYEYADLYNKTREGLLSTMARSVGSEVGNIAVPEGERFRNLIPASGTGAELPVSAREAHLQFEMLQGLIQNSMDTMTGGKAPRIYTPMNFETQKNIKTQQAEASRQPGEPQSLLPAPKPKSGQQGGRPKQEARIPIPQDQADADAKWLSFANADNVTPNQVGQWVRDYEQRYQKLPVGVTREQGGIVVQPQYMPQKAPGLSQTPPLAQSPQGAAPAPTQPTTSQVTPPAAAPKAVTPPATPPSAQAQGSTPPPAPSRLSHEEEMKIIHDVVKAKGVPWVIQQGLATQKEIDEAMGRKR